MAAFVVFHQWLKKYSKRHKYSKTDYIATKSTETDNPSPSSIQPAAKLIFHIYFCQFFFSLCAINASIHCNIHCIWLNCWIMQLNNDTNTVTLLKIYSSFYFQWFLYYRTDSDFPGVFVVSIYIIYIRLCFCNELSIFHMSIKFWWSRKTTKTMSLEIQKDTWWSVRFQYSTKSSCLRWYNIKNCC